MLFHFKLNNINFNMPYAIQFKQYILLNIKILITYSLCEIFVACKFLFYINKCKNVYVVHSNTF